MLTALFTTAQCSTSGGFFLEKAIKRYDSIIVIASWDVNLLGSHYFMLPSHHHRLGLIPRLHQRASQGSGDEELASSSRDTYSPPMSGP